MERNPLIAPQVPSNDEAQVHALTEDYFRVGNEPGSGGGKGWDPETCPRKKGWSGVQLEGGGRPRPPADRQPPRTYNSIIHSPSSNEVQFSSVRTRTLLRRPWTQGTVQSNRTRAARGTRRRPNCAMSAARTSLRARAPPPRRSSTSALAAAPLLRTGSPRGAPGPRPSRSVRMLGPWSGREVEGEEGSASVPVRRTKVRLVVLGKTQDRASGGIRMAFWGRMATSCPLLARRVTMTVFSQTCPFNTYITSWNECNSPCSFNILVAHYATY